MHSLYANVASVRILSQSHTFKWRCPQYVFANEKNVLKTLCSPLSKIICTHSKLQGASCKLETVQDKSSAQESLFINDSFLKENFKIVDSRYFKLLTVPNEHSYFEEILWTNEFKDILCRSPFLYNVNLAEYSKAYLLPPSVIKHHKNLEDILCYHEDQSKSTELSDFCDHVLLSSNTKDVKENESNRPTEEQLLHIIDRLTYSLLNFFEKPHDYAIYHKNIVFENNIKGVTIKGITAYMQNMYMLRFYGYLQYAKVKVEILKITHHIEDGSIRVRWRVNGLPRHKVILMFLKLRFVHWEVLMKEAQWLDGFSVFSVGQDGLIYKHVCNKMMPDDEALLGKPADLRSRLLGLLGLSPRSPAASSLSALIPYYKYQGLICKKLT